MDTLLIYQSFKKRIKESVDAVRLNTVIGCRRFSGDYLFGVEDSNDTLYSTVVSSIEKTAYMEVENLLIALCNAYGYPAAKAGDGNCRFDLSLEKEGVIYNVELKSTPRTARRTNPRRGGGGAMENDFGRVVYVYLLKPTVASYNALADSFIPGEEPNGYLFGDFIELIFGREEVERFSRSTINFAKEMKDALGYQLTEICNEKNLTQLRQSLDSYLLQFDYSSVRVENDATGEYREYISDRIYRQIEENYKNNYRLLLGNGDFAISFLTSEWLYRQYLAVPYLDNTFIVEGYLKSIEQLLWDIIFIVGNGRTIGRANRNIGQDTQPIDTVLGSLRYFIACPENDDLYHSAFGKCSGYVRGYLNRQLDQWTKNSRNHHFHKDNLQGGENVERLRRQTYFLYQLILGSLSLSSDNIKKLMG